ncbi:hypothetical protein DPMN_113982 [Dreissena polymorpha]|uniref:Uncharacterized protein n=1 Tax=Dreissena polymorpha TaxID=45954 RepID=A0A9D4KIE1_DREPO|nr:hypothetical protein DPMN_113982 [Dreissena polymorpha]
MPKDLGREEVAQGVDPVTSHIPTKKGNLNFCKLKSKAEELLADEHGLIAKRSTVEQIFNYKIIVEKHLQHEL